MELFALRQGLVNFLDSRVRLKMQNVDLWRGPALFSGKLYKFSEDLEGGYMALMGLEPA